MTTTIANFIGAFSLRISCARVGVSRVAEGYKRLQHRRDYSGLHNYPFKTALKLMTPTQTQIFSDGNAEFMDESMEVNMRNIRVPETVFDSN
jgi:hypothetical protein